MCGSSLWDGSINKAIFKVNLERLPTETEKCRAGRRDDADAAASSMFGNKYPILRFLFNKMV